MRSVARAARPHQWVKNLLVFVPLAASHQVADPALLWRSGLAFIAFSLVASAMYLVNDLVDRDRDRNHPDKNRRPLAAGALSAAHAGYAVTALAGAGFLIGLPLGAEFLSWISAYAVLVVLYSLFLKRVFVLDAWVLAGFYVLRIIAGGSASGITPSTWLLSFALFLFFTLAVLKRYREVCACDAAEQRWTIEPPGYAQARSRDLVIAGWISLGTALAVLVAYLDSTAVRALYPAPALLWILPVPLIAWQAHMWRSAALGHMDSDPVLFALRDRFSLVAVSLMGLVVWLAASTGA